MKPRILRCFSKKVEFGYAAVCIDLNLAAQGNTYAEAKTKLESMIESYVSEAFGEDSEYQEQLLNRKAPISLRFEYYLAWAVCKIAEFVRTFPRPIRSALVRCASWLPKSFNEPMPPNHAV